MYQEGEQFEEQPALEETDINQRPPCRQTNMGLHLEENRQVMYNAFTKDKDQSKPQAFVDNRSFLRPPSRHKTPPKNLGLDLPPLPVTPPENKENCAVVCDMFENKEEKANESSSLELEWGPISDDSSSDGFD